MARYRNISKETLLVVTPLGLIEVEHGGLVSGDDSTYWQTGVQGERALWEAVDAEAKAHRKLHTQSEEMRSGVPAILPTEPVGEQRSPSQATPSEGDQ